MKKTIKLKYIGWLIFIVGCRTTTPQLEVLPYRIILPSGVPSSVVTDDKLSSSISYRQIPSDYREPISYAAPEIHAQEPEAMFTPHYEPYLSATSSLEDFELMPGVIIFNSKYHMTQGVTEIIDAQIYRGILRNNNNVLEEEVKNINISRVTCVDLIQNDSDFIINQIGEDIRCQAVKDNDYTTWKWLITPLHSGTLKLHLVVTNEVTVNDKSKYRNEVVTVADIFVYSNPRYVLWSWFKTYWQWLLSSLGGVSGIALAVKWFLIKKEKQHSHGFNIERG
jgi:hypothetical protein